MKDDDKMICEAPKKVTGSNLRKIKSSFMTLLMIMATVVILLPLVIIFFHIVKMGFSSINLDFFMNIPKPTGETGGGMANGMVGSLVLIAMASVIGLPIGIFGAIYLVEYGGGRISNIIRFSADVLNGIPSIITGMVAYSLIVVPMKGFSALAGAVAHFCYYCVISKYFRRFCRSATRISMLPFFKLEAR